MKKCLLFLIGCFLVFGFTSCKDNLFDFDLKNIEANGEWGIPVFNDDISVEELLNKLDSVSFMRVGSDGTISFVMEKDLPDLVSMDRLLHFGGQTFNKMGDVSLDGSLDVHIEEVNILNLCNEDVFLKRAVINHGSMDLTFAFSDLPANYSGIAYTNNILDANGNPLTVNVSNTIQTQNIDLSGYVIQGNIEGNVAISADLTLVPTAGSTIMGTYHFTCTAIVTELDVQSIVALINPLNAAVVKSLGVDFSWGDFHIDNMQINNPRIQLFAKNSLCNINGIVNGLSFVSNSGTTSPLISSPVTAQIPISPYNYVQVVDVTTPNVQFTSDYDSLRFKGDVTVNPAGFAAGDLYLNKNSNLGLQLKATFPANLSIDNAVYRDEMDNALYGAFTASEASSLEGMTLRLAFTNNLPLDMIADVSFLNTTTSDTTKLVMSSNIIHGSYNGKPYYETPIYVEAGSQMTKKILESDKVLLGFRINTQGNTVELNTTSSIKVAIGAKLKYNHISMNN